MAINVGYRGHTDRHMRIEFHGDWDKLALALSGFEAIREGDALKNVVYNTPFITDMMQRIAPVLTGFLRDHIVWRNIRTPYYKGVEIESGAYYSGFQEYGTSRNPPHWFFRPPLYRGWDIIKDEIYDMGKKAVRV